MRRKRPSLVLLAVARSSGKTDFAGRMEVSIEWRGVVGSREPSDHVLRGFTCGDDHNR